MKTKPEIIDLINKAIKQYNTQQKKSPGKYSLAELIYVNLFINGVIIDPDALFDYPTETNGTKLAAEVRAKCNKLTPEERQKYLDAGMKMIYDKAND